MKKVKTIHHPNSAEDHPRVQKYLSSMGFGSRRGIESLLRQGRITINGRLAVLGDKVREGDRVAIDGGRTRRVNLRRVKIKVLAYNKPVGVVSSRDGSGKWQTVYRDLPKESGFRWVSIGRLDLNTSGLMLFTNDGQLASRLMHPSFQLDREYIVRVYGEVTREKILKMKEGVEIDGESYHLNDVVKGKGDGANHWYTCVVQSGRNREVRRIWESQDVRVSRLTRVRFANIMLPLDLRPGSTVELGENLTKELRALVELERI